ncbi:MAG: M48 family metalloprotease [Myxococcales bacterium]|nr:M48 family metalloprotease [Myxococcales bacterium]
MSIMNAQDVRCSLDEDLAAKLLDDPVIKTVNQQIERQEEEGSQGTRRQLLATALRVTEAMAPGLHRETARCCERLGVDIPVEVYVYPSATFNAACVKPEAGRLFLMFSSSLLEAFEGDELAFVVGHELGHHLYGHHDIPIGLILQGQVRPPAPLVLRLFAWSRYAEISADRAGALCTTDTKLRSVAKALFRLASGLRRDDLVELDLQALAEQVQDMETEGEMAVGTNQADWFSTHPFSPLRVMALECFQRSVFVTQGGAEKVALDTEVQSLMALMEPSYLEDKSEVAETMRRLLFAATVAIIHAGGVITDAEIAEFERLFGAGSWSSSIDADAVVGTIDSRVADAIKLVPHAKRMQVMRDLCLVAQADGRIEPEEQRILRQLAKRLELQDILVAQGIACGCELD